jgi:hypothetical protein
MDNLKINNRGNAKELKSLANSNKNVKTPHAMQHD